MPLSAFVSLGRSGGVGGVGGRGGYEYGGGLGGGVGFASGSVKRASLPKDFAPGGEGVVEGGEGAAGAGGGAGAAGAAAPVESVVARRVWSVHVTQDTVGGAVASEIRVFGPLSRRCRLHSLAVIPLAGVTAGQFFDVLVSGDGDTTDTANPTGSSIFSRVRGTLPLPDNDVGVSVPVSTLRLTDVADVLSAGQYIKVFVYFRAPAVALPDVSFVFELDELAGRTSTVVARVVPRVTAPVVVEGEVVSASPAAEVTPRVVVPALVEAGGAVLPAAALALLGRPAAGGGEGAAVPVVPLFDPAAAAAIRVFDPAAAVLERGAGSVDPEWFHPSGS